MSLCEQCFDRGQCCRYIELPVPLRALTVDETKWVELHPGLSASNGWVVTMMTDMGPSRGLHWNISCSALQPDGLCGLYGTPFRPEMCSVWPDRPEEQAPDECAYLNQELVNSYAGSNRVPT